MASNRIKFQVEGPEDENGDVRFDVFIRVLGAFRKALTETDRLISKGDSSLYFRVSDLTHSSPATIEVEGVEKDLGIVADKTVKIYSLFSACVGNLNSVLHDNPLPLMDYPTLMSYKELAAFHGRGIARMSILNNGDRIVISESLERDIEEALGPDLTEFGSIVGRLERINLHNNSNKFTIYPIINGIPSLTCVFPNTLRGQVVDAVDSHVAIYGIKKFKSLSPHPYEIQVHSIEIIKKKGESSSAPKLASLRGVAQGSTGDMSSEEFVRSLRDGWQ
jgi:hypothetical protein